MAFLVLLKPVIVAFVFFRLQISDEMFLIHIVIFLEKFYLLLNPISYRDVCHSGLHQNRCYLLMKVLVVVY